MAAGAQKIVRRFSQLTIAVWGDFVADEFVAGEIARVSREAPVLILKRRTRVWAAGGGANAAVNLAALGVRVRAVGCVGDDEAGSELLRLFASAGINRRGVARLRGRGTPTKTRILAHHAHTTPQQVVRLDHEPPPLPAALQAKLAQSVRRAVRGAHGVLISDYGYGAVDPAASVALRKLLPQAAPLCVDARYRIRAYRGCTAATPNEAELEAALAAPIASPRALERAGRKLARQLACPHLLVTRGRDGMALFEPRRRTLLLPVVGSQQALDVTGAGDTVIAVFTAALAAGADGPTAAALANHAGGIVVMKPGTATVSAAELLQAVGN